MQGHDGEEFAGFGEHEGQVVDVGEGGVAEWGGEGGGQGNQEEREEHCAGGKDVERAAAGLVEEVETAAGEGEGGLDGVQYHGKAEVFFFGSRVEEG